MRLVLPGDSRGRTYHAARRAPRFAGAPVQRGSETPSCGVGRRCAHSALATRRASRTHPPPCDVAPWVAPAGRSRGSLYSREASRSVSYCRAAVRCHSISCGVTGRNMRSKASRPASRTGRRRRAARARARPTSGPSRITLASDGGSSAPAPRPPPSAPVLSRGTQTAAQNSPCVRPAARHARTVSGVRTHEGDCVRAAGVSQRGDELSAPTATPRARGIAAGAGDASPIPGCTRGTRARARAGRRRSGGPCVRGRRTCGGRAGSTARASPGEPRRTRQRLSGIARSLWARRATAWCFVTESAGRTRALARRTTVSRATSRRARDAGDQG